MSRSPSPSASPFSSAQSRLLAGGIFDEYDHGPKGFLSRWEYHFAYTALFGVRPSREEERCVFGDEILLETDRDDAFGLPASSSSKEGAGISRETFLDRMEEQSRYIGEMDPLWAQFDSIDAALKGYISFRDLEAAVKQCGNGLEEKLNAEVLRHCFERTDWDRDGRISFKDFRALGGTSSASHTSDLHAAPARRSSIAWRGQ